MSFNLLKIRQLDKRFAKLKNVVDQNIPAKDWISEIREALNLTYDQLSKRIGVSPPAVKKFEKRESEGTISLNSIRKVAEAMNCKLVYAIVPKDSLENIIDNQIAKVASALSQRASHSMNLENQKVNSLEEKKQLDELKISLKANLSSKIWKYEV